jgi:hypothetical protein
MTGHEARETPPPGKIDITVPHSARIWNYWLGGKDNYTVDRVAGDAFREIYPDITVVARAVRAFLARAVRHLAGAADIRQFLDVGTGLPTAANTSQARQQAHERYAQTGAVPYRLRSPEQIAAFFDGLDLLEPGVVPVSQWRPDPRDASRSGLPAAVDTFGGMARKR